MFAAGTNSELKILTCYHRGMKCRYTRETWNEDLEGDDDDDEEEASSSGSSTSEVVIVWEEYDWEELPDMIRKAYETLGYSEGVFYVACNEVTYHTWTEKLTRRISFN